MIIQGDNIVVMPGMEAGQFQVCVTSPPYWGLRDYGIPPSDWPEVTYTPMPGLPTVTVPAWTGCLGLEPTPEMFVAHTVHVFREVWRLLRDDGTLWLNYGDTYAGSGKGAWANKEAQKEVYVIDPGSEITKIPKNPSGLKNKDLVGIPWRVAFALQADGWLLRLDNIWNKPNCMPESVRDRPTKAHEYVFLLSKSEKYYYDAEAIKEPAVGFNNDPVASSAGAFGPEQSRRRKGNAKTFRGGGKYTGGQSFDNSELVERVSSVTAANETGLRNKRSVWTVATAQFAEAHFATFPEQIPETAILAGSTVGGKVFDPFGGSGTTLEVAHKHGRECTIIEIGPQYVEIAERRTANVQQMLQI